MPNVTVWYNTTSKDFITYISNSGLSDALEFFFFI